MISIDSRKDTLRCCNKLDSPVLIHYFYSRMIKNTLLVILLACSFNSTAQSSYCVDSSFINPYFSCIDCYKPVCGCDGKNYRNECDAVNHGGLHTSNFTPGVCDNFNFDFVPNPVNSQSPSPCSSFLNIFVNQYGLPTSSQVYLFDIFNRLKYSRFLYITTNDLFGSGRGTPVEELNADYFGSLENGVYILVVGVNGEQKSKKIIIANPK